MMIFWVPKCEHYNNVVTSCTSVQPCENNGYSLIEQSLILFVTAILESIINLGHPEASMILRIILNAKNNTTIVNSFNTVS